MEKNIGKIEYRTCAIGAFARLKAERLRSQAQNRTALNRRVRRVRWIAPSTPAIQLLLGTLPRRPMAINGFFRSNEPTAPGMACCMCCFASSSRWSAL